MIRARNPIYSRQGVLAGLGNFPIVLRFVLEGTRSLDADIAHHTWPLTSYRGGALGKLLWQLLFCLVLDLCGFWI